MLVETTRQGGCMHVSNINEAKANLSQLIKRALAGDEVISGPWGIGKTYFVKNFLDAFCAEDRTTYIYVSLYGLRSHEEIDAAIFQAIYVKYAKRAGKVGETLARLTGIMFKNWTKSVDDDGEISKQLNKFVCPKILVFDDLERAKMPLDEMLGCINQFVEHDAGRVIVLANEQILEADTDYAARKEKVIGKTLVVHSVLNQALDYFLEQLEGEKAKSFLKEKKEDISTIYRMSKTNNLRLLQHALWDFERLLDSISKAQLQNKEGCTELLRFYLATSLEFKAGKITGEDIVNRTIGIPALKNPDRPDRFEVARRKYPLVDIAHPTLSNKLLSSCLVDGYFDQEDIQLELNQSPCFADQKIEPAWRTVWYFYEREENDIREAIAKMENHLNAMEAFPGGEILHISGCRIFLSKNGLLSVTPAEIVDQMSTYIDKLLESGKLDAMGTCSHDVFAHSFAGYGYMETPTSEFAAIRTHLKAKMEIAYERKIAEWAKELLKIFATDGVAFSRLISERSGQDRRWVDSPVLSKIDVSEFLDLYFAASAVHQVAVQTAFRVRYTFAAVGAVLAAERQWLNELKTNLTNRIVKSDLVQKMKIERFVNVGISPYISNTEEPF
jgi:KAP family P-loop domain